MWCRLCLCQVAFLAYFVRLLCLPLAGCLAFLCQADFLHSFCFAFLCQVAVPLPLFIRLFPAFLCFAFLWYGSPAFLCQFALPFFAILFSSLLCQIAFPSLVRLFCCLSFVRLHCLPLSGCFSAFLCQVALTFPL